MSKRISELLGMDIYSLDGKSVKYVGKIHDLVINVQEGRVTTITTESLANKLKVRAVQEAEEIIRSKSIAFDKVQAVGDIVLVANTNAAPAVPKGEQKTQSEQKAGSYRKLRLKRSMYTYFYINFLLPSKLML